MTLLSTLKEPSEVVVKFLNEKFSDWKKITNIIGWILRFIDNSRRSNEKITEKTLTPIEFQSAENLIIKYAQKLSFHEEICALQMGTDCAIKLVNAIHLPQNLFF